MKPIRTREDLLALAIANAPTKACARVIRERGATILGGFNPVQDHPGWILQVHSPYGKSWIIGIEVIEHARKHRVLVLDAVPWPNRTGDGV